MNRVESNRQSNKGPGDCANSPGVWPTSKESTCDESSEDIAPRGQVHRGYTGGSFDIPIVHPHQRLVGEERKQVAKQLRAEYDDGASIRDLAAQTGYSIQRVRSLLKMTGELRQQGRHIGDGH